MREIESKYLTCPYCNFSDSTATFGHIAEGKTKCDNCGEVFRFKVELYKRYTTNTIQEREEK